MFRERLTDTPWPHKAGSRTALGPLLGSAGSAVIAELATADQPLIVLAASSADALVLARELPLFLPSNLPVLTLPDWETLPYDHFSPHQDIVSQRLRTFYELPNLTAGIVIVPITTAMLRTPPRYFVEGNTLDLSTGEQFNLERFTSSLTLNGYRAVETVMEHGEFAVRGALLDVFPMGSATPYRIDLFDNEVETLRTFDPETQRTVAQVPHIKLMPAREFPVNSDAIRRFQMAWYDAFDGDADLCPTFIEISAGRVPGGAEYYLPLFFEACGSVFDYLPESAAITVLGDHYSAAQRYWADITGRYEEYGIDPRRPLLPPKRGFLAVEELYEKLGQHAVLELKTTENAPAHVITDFKPPPMLTGPAETDGYQNLLGRFIEDHQGPVLLCAASPLRTGMILLTAKFALGLPLLRSIGGCTRVRVHPLWSANRSYLASALPSEEGAPRATRPTPTPLSAISPNCAWACPWFTSNTA